MLCKMDTDVEVEKGDSEEAKAGKAVLPEAQVGGGNWKIYIQKVDPFV